MGGTQAFPLATAGQGTFPQLFVHLFDKYLLSAYWVANTVPEDGNVVMNNKDKILALLQVIF